MRSTPGQEDAPKPGAPPLAAPQPCDVRSPAKALGGCRGLPGPGKTGVREIEIKRKVSKAWSQRERLWAVGWGCRQVGECPPMLAQDGVAAGPQTAPSDLRVLQSRGANTVQRAWLSGQSHTGRDLHTGRDRKPWVPLSPQNRD